ncbi:trypsin-like peptidase domain-containing protein [Fibrella sp. WM1]|uniref:trypsin-like peptidase domain-containing protein n=1 Tax=Fibrella musci TaxID=3242485 RepID=UPI0035227EFA
MRVISIVTTAAITLLMSQVSIAQIATRRVEAGLIQSRIPASMAKMALATVSAEPTQLAIVEAIRTDSIERKLGGFPVRFGIALSVDYGLAAGKWVDVSGGRVWTLRINSPGAHSLNFLFDKFRLAKGTILTLYNADRTMQMGPITDAANNPANLFATDLLAGSSIIIELFEPTVLAGSKEVSALHISRLTHAYRNLFPTVNNYGDALSCEINTSCTEGSPYQAQTNSVAMVLLAGGDRICSSTLLNTTCQNFRPYMLTAFHCLDRGNGNCNDADTQNATLSQNEINASQAFVFRFQYKSPNCTPTSEPSVTYSFQGATFRAANQASDFALLELNQVPSPITGIRYAGWNRSTVISSTGAILHHPNGDVMKVSTFNQAPTIRTTDLLASTGCSGKFLSYPMGNIFTVTLNTGATEGGSSGGGVFDANGRVFAQVNSGVSACNNNIKQTGALAASWTGGGTNSTQLSNWLDPSNTGATTTNELSSIPYTSGPAFFCTTGQFVLNNVPAGASVSWSVNPSSAVSPSSGTGSIANLTRVGSADATITFQIGCDNGAPFSANFHVGDYSSSNYPVSGPTFAGCNQKVYYSTNQLPGATSYTWSWPSGWTYLSGQNTYSLAVRTSNIGGLVSVRAGACGGQGGSPASVYTSVSGCFARINVFPNPTSEVVQVEFDQVDTASFLPEQLTIYSEKTMRPVRSISIRDAYSRKAFRDGNKIDVNVSDLPRGIYYIHFTNTGNRAGEVERVRLLLN